jgi:hypothetical protein
VGHLTSSSLGRVRQCAPRLKDAPRPVSVTLSAADLAQPHHFSTVPHLPCPAHTRSTPRQETRLWDSLLLIKPPTLMSGAFCFYGICRKKRGPTSGLEPFSCSSYEFACARSSPSWCVRKLRLSMGFSAPPPRLRVHCVVACTSPVAVNPLAKTLIADLIITSDNSCVAEVLPTAIRDPYAPIDWPS